ncbi:MAG: glycosyltransferase family 39 protein [Acidobacteria bacterium]|nr:glycosyltransferase family 39 protein [Acidobacteriota bacterium]
MHIAAREFNRRSLLLASLLGVWLLVYVPGLFRPALLDDADSVHAEAAKEMVQRHDWVTMHINGGFRYLEKAPLMYWTIAASFRIFGISEWSARLPLALGMLALLLATFAIGRRTGGNEAGFYAALILGTAFGPYLFTRILIPDILVGLWLALGLGFFLRAVNEQRPSRLVCWGFAATTALNALTKGLIGLIFPLAIAGIYLLLTRRLRHLFAMRPLSSTVVFLAIAAPWHILAAVRNPPMGQAKGFLWFYFVNEHFLRYLNMRVPRDYDTVPLFVFWGLMLLWLFPWSVFVLQALGQVPIRFRRIHSGLDAPRQASLLFGLWMAVVLGFFSFSTRQEYYALPALPALALLIGNWLARESQAAAESPLGRSGRVSSLVLFIVGVAGSAVALALALISQPAPPHADIADLLAKNPEKYALSLGHFFDLTPQALGAFRLPLLITGLALVTGTGLNWLFRRRASPFHGNLVLAAMGVAVLCCAHLGLLIFEPVLSSKALALAIWKEYQSGEVVVIHGEYEESSTLNFYTGIQLHILNGRRSNLWYGSLFPDSPRIFEDGASFAQLWEGPTRVYLWTDAARMPEILRDGSSKNVYELARAGGKSIFSNRPTQD